MPLEAPVTSAVPRDSVIPSGARDPFDAGMPRLKGSLVRLASLGVLGKTRRSASALSLQLLPGRLGTPRFRLARLLRLPRQRPRAHDVGPRVRELRLAPAEQAVEEHDPHRAAHRESHEAGAPPGVVVPVDPQGPLALRDPDQAPVVEADRVIADLGAVLEE